MAIELTTTSAGTLSAIRNALQVASVSAVSVMQAATASWNSTYTTFNANSGEYESTYTTVNAQSANNASVYTTVNAQSANNASVYTTTNANSGAWLGYMVTLTPTITTNLVANIATIHYPPSLSGAINASDITGKLAYNKGMMQMRFHLETPNNTATNKRFRLEFADNINFTGNTNIINTSDASFLSMSTTREGLITLSGSAPQQIVFQSTGGSTADGKQSNNLATYTYVTGTPIYWRAGFALALGTEVYALCAGYIRISSY